jgi:hypothetical protein
MPLFNRQVKTTPRQLADALYEAAIDGTQKLIESLGDTSVAEQLKQRKNSHPWGSFEVIFFCLFPFDLIINRQFGSRASDIREALRESAIEHFQQSGGTETDSFANAMEQRFTEYAHALKNSEGPQAMTHIGSLSLSHILGMEDVRDIRAITNCIISFAGTMKGFADIGSKYRIL